MCSALQVQNFCVLLLSLFTSACSSQCCSHHWLCSSHLPLQNQFPSPRPSIIPALSPTYRFSLWALLSSLLSRILLLFLLVPLDWALLSPAVGLVPHSWEQCSAQEPQQISATAEFKHSYRAYVKWSDFRTGCVVCVFRRNILSLILAQTKRPWPVTSSLFKALECLSCWGKGHWCFLAEWWHLVLPWFCHFG